MEQQEGHRTGAQIPPMAAGLIAEIQSVLAHITPENYVDQLLEIDRIMALFNFDRLTSRIISRRSEDGSDTTE